MKKSLLLLAALACTGAIAQEKQIWACQQQASAALEWENGSWKRYGVNPIPLLLTIDGANSSYKMGEYEFALRCEEIEFEPYISCIATGTGSQHFYLDPNNGKLGTSLLFGAINTGVIRDTVGVQIYNCTKF